MKVFQAENGVKVIALDEVQEAAFINAGLVEVVEEVTKETPNKK
jgi:hypothetical protein